MDQVQIHLALQRIYEKECKTCTLKGNGRVCGSGRPYKIHGRGFSEHEVKNKRCDAYVKEEKRR